MGDRAKQLALPTQVGWPYGSPYAASIPIAPHGVGQAMQHAQLMTKQQRSTNVFLHVCSILV